MAQTPIPHFRSFADDDFTAADPTAHSTSGGLHLPPDRRGREYGTSPGRCIPGTSDTLRGPRRGPVQEHPVLHSFRPDAGLSFSGFPGDGAKRYFDL